MDKITTCLWFDHEAEEAARFYVSIFRNATLLSAGGTSVTFELNGQRFIGLNGGPDYTFTPAVSFMIDCATQADVDHYWDRLGEGGQAGRCGWLVDRFGLSWQVVPTCLGDLLADDDDAKSEAVLHAMLQMTKLDIAALEAAARNASASAAT